jgi:hypothetical protein
MYKEVIDPMDITADIVKIHQEMRLMRNPDRMYPMLEMLLSLWQKYPDMRLGQLIENVAGHKNMIWNMDDNEMYDKMEEIYKRGWT